MKWEKKIFKIKKWKKKIQEKEKKEKEMREKEIIEKESEKEKRNMIAFIFIITHRLIIMIILGRIWRIVSKEGKQSIKWISTWVFKDTWCYN